jgi:hypothetical protein
MCRELYTTSVVLVTDTASSRPYGAYMKSGAHHRRDRQMKRLATALAVAGLAVGAFATTAGARPYYEPEDYAATPAAAKSSAAKKPALKKDTRPAKVVYKGFH